MIIADNNVIVPLYLEETFSATCETLYAQEGTWITPYLWQSEFKHVLTRSVKEQKISGSEATKIFDTAHQTFGLLQQAVAHEESLELSLKYSLSAYDGEYVWLAEHLDLPLITCDGEILKRAKHVAIHPEEYLAR